MNHRENHHFEIGNSHKICQDYCLSGHLENFSYAILSDGCSSSPNVDLGARFLCLSAKKLIESKDLKFFELNSIFFRSHIQDYIFNIENYLKIPIPSFDATLLVVWVDHQEKTFTCYMYGDGIFFHKESSLDRLRIVNIDFEQNSPDYISYYLDNDRFLEYQKNIKTNKKITDQSFSIKDSSIIKTNKSSLIKPFDSVEFRGMINEGDVIGVMSDGINSFSNNEVSVDKNIIVKDLIDFKSTTGVFVERRMLALKRQWVKEKITHYDDISVSSIVI